MKRKKNKHWVLQSYPGIMLRCILVCVCVCNIYEMPKTKRVSDKKCARCIYSIFLSHSITLMDLVLHLFGAICVYFTTATIATNSIIAGVRLCDTRRMMVESSYSFSFNDWDAWCVSFSLFQHGVSMRHRSWNEFVMFFSFVSGFFSCTASAVC